MDRTGKVDGAYNKMRESKGRGCLVDWKQLPGESGAEWLRRLDQVPEKERKGRKLEFYKLQLKAQRLQLRELDNSRRDMGFDLPAESEEAYRWSRRRRDTWPEKYRSHFPEMLLRIAERLKLEDRAEQRAAAVAAEMKKEPQSDA
jgi:hypothetical protein